MTQFKKTGGQTAFSEITDHFSEGKTGQAPVQKVLSDFYSGGRYVLERRDRIQCFPDSKKLSYSTDADKFFDTYYLMAARCNDLPDTGDLIGLYKADGSAYATDNHGVSNSNNLWIHGAIRYDEADAAGWLSKFPGSWKPWNELTTSEKAYFGDVYFLLTENPIYLQFDADEVEGASAEEHLRFSRGKFEIFKNRTSEQSKAAIHYTDLLNPSTIPVEDATDDEGTEIKFSDFHGGYRGLIRGDKETTYQTYRHTANETSTKAQTTRSTSTTKSRTTVTTYNTTRSTNTILYYTITKMTGTAWLTKKTTYWSVKYIQKTGGWSKFGGSPIYFDEVYGTRGTNRETDYATSSTWSYYTKGHRYSSTTTAYSTSKETTTSWTTTGNTTFEIDRLTTGITRFNTTKTTEEYFWD